jgi:hypothetical protein
MLKKLNTLSFKFVEKWYIPLLGLIFSFITIIYLLLEIDNTNIFLGKKTIQIVVIIFFILNILSLLLLFYISFILLKRKKLVKGLFLSFIAIIFILIYLFFFYLLINDSHNINDNREIIYYENDSIIFYENDNLDRLDHFADSLLIPKNTKLHNPIKNHEFKNDRFFKSKFKSINKEDVFIYNSLISGDYLYDIYLSKIDEGHVFLRAFEITKGTELSIDGLKDETIINVYNPKNEFKRFGNGKKFTIWEGDESKPYAARFEVWFKPKKRGDVRKLFSKNYIIYGYYLN